MTGGFRLSARRTLAAAVTLGCLAACSSTTSGSGRAAPVTDAPTSSPTPSATSPDASPPIGTPSTTPPGAAGSSSAVPKRQLSVTGAESHVSYDITVWDSDDIADCSTHAYGTAMIRFLGAHPCRGAHRVLATVPLNGRVVALSAITTSFPGTPSDPYAATAQFSKLEQADGTGAINDLLREGGTLPGADRIPSTEAFSVLAQDAGVTVFDAWYLNATTADQDPALVALEQNLFLTPFTDA